MNNTIKFTQEEMEVLADFHMNSYITSPYTGHFVPHSANPAWANKSEKFRDDLKTKCPWAYNPSIHLWKLDTDNPQIKELVDALDLL